MNFGRIPVLIIFTMFLFSMSVAEPVCGDGTCGEGEDQIKCINDCGCQFIICGDKYCNYERTLFMPGLPKSLGRYTIALTKIVDGFHASISVKNQQGTSEELVLEMGKAQGAFNNDVVILLDSLFQGQVGDQVLLVISTCPQGLECEKGVCVIPSASPACGNGMCESGENCGNCISDCACPTGLTCENNRCAAQTPAISGIIALIIQRFVRFLGLI